MRSLCWSMRASEPSIRAASCVPDISMLNTATGALLVHRDVLADVQRERGLAHARPAGDDHEVALLQPGGHGVEIAVAGRHAGDVARVVAAVEEVDPLHHLREQLMDVVEAAAGAGARLRDLEHLRLGLVEQLPDLLAGRAERAVGDVVADRDELPHDRALAHDLGVAADVVRRRRVLREARQVGEPAGPLLVLARLDRLGDRDHVGRLALLDELRDVPEDAPVIVAVEIVDGDRIADAIPRAVVEEQPAEHRLLGLDRVRRDLQADELTVGRSRARTLGEGLRHGARFYPSKGRGPLHGPR